MAFLSLLVILIVLNIVYVIGLLGAQLLRKSPQHYFLGFDRGLITFSFRNVKFTLGIYIPIIGLSRVYCVDMSGKKQLFYPWQIAHASLTKRLLLTYSGVLTLFVVGVLIAIISLYTSSEQYIAKDEVIRYGVYPSPQARTAGFLPGDKVIAVNGRDYDDFSELVRSETIHSAQTNYTILREGRELILSLTDTSVQNLPPHELFLTINAPFSVGDVLPESPAEKAGILSGDKIAKVNGHPVMSSQEMNSYFESDEDGEVVLEIQRGDNFKQKFEKILALNVHRKIGIYIEQKIEYRTRVYSFAESAKLGATRFWSGILVQFKMLGRTLGLGQEEEKLSGPIGISAAFGNFSFSRFAFFTSMYMAFIISLNFLPLPKSAMLEVIPIGYEAVKRKPLSYRSFRRIRKVSIVLLLMMMVWQLVSDVAKLF